MTPTGSYGFLWVPISTMGPCGSMAGAISEHDDDDDRGDDVGAGDDDHVVGDDDDDGGGNDGDDDGGGVDDGGDDEFVLMMVMLMVMTVLVQGSSNGEPRNPHPCTTLKLRARSLLVRLRLPRAVVGSIVLRRSTFWSEKGSRRGLHLAPTHPHRAHTGQCRNEGTRQLPRTRHVVGISSESQGHP